MFEMIQKFVNSIKFTLSHSFGGVSFVLHIGARMFYVYRAVQCTHTFYTRIIEQSRVILLNEVKNGKQMKREFEYTCRYDDMKII